MFQGKRIAILVEEEFEDIELVEPMRAMKDLGVRVVIVGSGSKESYRGIRGTTMVKADTTADKVRADEFDVIIIPGGSAPDSMCRCQAMVDLVKKAHDAGKIIATISDGAGLLIPAGIAKNRQITSSPLVADSLRNAGAHWVDARVVRDGNIITSRRLTDLPSFEKAIIESLVRLEQKRYNIVQASARLPRVLATNSESAGWICMPASI